MTSPVDTHVLDRARATVTEWLPERHLTREGFLRPDVAQGTDSPWPGGDAGQSTTEYAFVLVVVAVIGLALYAVGPEKIQALFSSIVDKLSGDAQSKVKLHVP